MIKYVSLDVSSSLSNADLDSRWTTQPSAGYPGRHEEADSVASCKDAGVL